ncbi:hypothetical protein KUV22_02750 [Microbulbifer agarilyticus]|uniref:hypothetical protein n=1 Tax=Microbulbifer agarilyticus TaxID=260552 RepID=UPI001C94ECAE|nr:hypothetical protein [Microbulbifer agarilyticus]MBY6189327.1 hypothetical protein [Microbulbifer agarilyticus]
MQSITITCSILILIGLVGFYSQDLVHSQTSIIRDPAAEEISPALANLLESGSIFERKSEEEILRFSLYRSFDNPVWITLNFSNELMLIESYRDESDPYTDKVIDLSVKLDSQYVRSVKEKVVKSYLASEGMQSENGLDGSTWIVELAWQGKYYTSDLWSPDFGPEYQLGHQLFARAQRYASLGRLY